MVSKDVPIGKCLTAGSGVTASSLIQSSGPGDDPLYVVFFSSRDCDPDTEIRHADESDKCFDVGFQSYEIWSVCPDDNPGCLN